MISFGVVQKFRSNARPLNSGLEKNALHIWIQNDLSFSKLFEISKLDEKWQVNNPIIQYIALRCQAKNIINHLKVGIYV